MNTNDFVLANEFNFDAKINEEVYFRRCMKKIVVLYDLKNKHCREIKQLRENRNVFSIGVENALDGVCQKKRATFAKSKWIGIVDSRGNRSMAKKFPLLNSALFTKQTPECEIQGQTLLGKFTTNEYHSTDKTHKDATELYKTIMRPFSNYRSVEAREKYPVSGSSELEKEFKEFEDYTKNYCSLKTCESFYLGVRTNSVESFFSTRLFHVPKNVTFRKMYRAKII